MGRQAIAYRRGEPVDKRYVAEAVCTTPVHPVRLEGIETVGHEYDQMTTLAGDAGHFSEADGIILNMLQDFVREY